MGVIMAARHRQQRAAIGSFSLIASLVLAASAQAQTHTWPGDAEFSEGTFDHLHVNDSGQIAVDFSTQVHLFTWVAKTGRNTIVRIDADTGTVLGEYRTAPSFSAGDPSRTVVDRDGNVWVGNMNEASDGRGSIAQIGLVIGGTRVRKNADGSVTADIAGEYLAPPYDYSTAIDRDGDGLIRTSRGLEHVLAWPSGDDADGGSPAFVEQAFDECIRVFQRTTAPYVHHVAMDADGFVWVGGYGAESTGFDKLDPQDGSIVESLLPGCGGFGGIVDGAGAVWSSSLNQGVVLRYDPLTGTQNCLAVPSPYGLAVDAGGFVWATTWTGNSVVKISPEGAIVDGFPKPAGGSRSSGIAIGADGDVWVAHHASGRVARIDANGNVRTTIATGSAPMGVDVDARGRVWVTHLNHHNVVRIDPQGGSDGLGAVDLSVPLGYRAGPVGIGRMAAALELRTYAPDGSWVVQFDGGQGGVRWSRAHWEGEAPATTQVTLQVRAADDQAALQTIHWVAVDNDEELNNIQGRYFELQMGLSASADGRAAPRIDLVLVTRHESFEPVVLFAQPSVESLWPPNHRMVPVQIAITDPNGRMVDYRITQITQDEPIASLDDSSERIPFDAVGTGEAVAYLRAERSGDGNGRVYEIHYETIDEIIGAQQGSVHVCVPHDRGRGNACIDDGQLYDATGGISFALKQEIFIRQFPNPFNPNTTIEYELRQPGTVTLSIFDIRGRRVRDLVRQQQAPGLHRAAWDGRDQDGASVASGVYLYRLHANDTTVMDRMLMMK